MGGKSGIDTLDRRAAAAGTLGLLVSLAKHQVLEFRTALEAMIFKDGHS
jgi:hypothetical protein